MSECLNAPHVSPWNSISSGKNAISHFAFNHRLKIIFEVLHLEGWYIYLYIINLIILHLQHFDILFYL
jgi:hypothetical protein